MSTPINTAKVQEFRVLRFNSIDEALAEVDRIAAAERAGKLRRSGNWATGQVFGHLATWIEFAYDGYPPDMKPPFIIKLVLKLQKKKFLRGPMPRGVKIPGVKGGTKGIEPVSFDEGYTRLRRALERLKAGSPSGPNVIFGPMTHEEWKAMHSRHAELHLGYLHPA
jgi:hypothetical protein